MTDVAGYRQDGSLPAGSPGDAEVAKIVNNKGPLLNAPGTKLANSLYYDVFSSAVFAPELQNYYARDIIAFQSKTIGGQSSVYIPSVLFTGNTHLRFKLQGTSGSPILWPNSIPDGSHFILNEGWGASCVRSHLYYLGSSSVANIEIIGESNIAIMLASCETEEKRRQVWLGCGRLLAAFRNQLVKGQHLAQPQAGAALFRNNVDRINENGVIQGLTIEGAVNTTADPGLLTAFVPLRMPWNNMLCLAKRLPFDTKLLTQPIRISVYTQALECSTDLATVKNTTFFNQFEEYDLIMEQQELSDKSLSLREELLAAPDYHVSLPFMYAQSMTFPVGNGGSGSFSFGSITSTNITSFINADLTTIWFMVRSADDNTQIATDGNKVSLARGTKLYGQELRNINIKLNGQIMFRYPDNAYEYVSLPNYMGKSVLTMHQLAIVKDFDKDGKATGNFNADLYSTNSYIYEINFSRLRAILNESNLQNTPRFTNQTMQVEFQIANTVGNFGWKGSYSSAYTLFCTYGFNAVFAVGGNGGQSALYTA